MRTFCAYHVCRRYRPVTPHTSASGFKLGLADNRTDLSQTIQDLLRLGKFSFAIENSAAYDYITEKLFQAFETGTGMKERTPIFAIFMRACSGKVSFQKLKKCAEDLPFHCFAFSVPPSAECLSHSSRGERASNRDCAHFMHMGLTLFSSTPSSPALSLQPPPAVPVVMGTPNIHDYDPILGAIISANEFQFVSSPL